MRSRCPGGWCSGCGGRCCSWWRSSGWSSSVEPLGLGTPTSRIVAGFAYALSPRILTLIGPISVEAWPSALAPWVLVPLVLGARGGSTRRAALLSALAVAATGGVNAAATFAVIPLAVAVAADPRAGAPSSFADDLVAAVRARGDGLVAGPPAPARALQPAVPRLHRDGCGDHRPDDSLRRPPGHLALGSVRRPDVAGGQRPRLDESPRTEQRSAAPVRDRGHDHPPEPAPAVPRARDVPRSADGDGGTRRGARGLVRRPEREALDGVLAPLRNVHKFDLRHPATARPRARPPARSPRRQGDGGRQGCRCPEVAERSAWRGTGSPTQAC